ncbi:FIG137478: Hypothetical protein [hydrothermal vent metagenome]|uniref:Uncharacterized protein n=1 Tax=hydrothermal vent metagenome TaxID=652676 RepID=A0A1W1B8K8_9ZZZZ
MDTSTDKYEDSHPDSRAKNHEDTENIVEEQPKREFPNPCNDPELKNQKEWKEYCKRKRYNDKLEAQQKQKELEEEESRKRAEEEYQESLRRWEDETRRENERLAKEFKKQRDEWRERQKRYDKEENEKIANELKKRREFQKQQQLNVKFINKFTPLDEWHDAYKRIKKLDKTKDTKKAKKIYNAYKKIYYDSEQIKEQGKAEYQNAKANEIGKKAKYVKTIKDTALTINKGLAKLDPTGTGDKIVTTMEHTYAAIEGAEKGGASGAIVKVMDLHTNGIATDTVDTAQDYHDLHTKGIKLNSDEKFYDKDGNRVTKIKSGEKTYATDKGDKGESKEFSLMDRVEKKTIKKLDDTYNPQTKINGVVENIKSGIVEGDFNKVANGVMDAKDLKDDLVGRFTDEEE